MCFHDLLIFDGFLQGRRFDEKDKAFCAAMYKCMGQKAYSFFRTIYPFLPSPQTLNDEIKQLNIKPGISDLILDYLKKKVAKFSKKQRVCVLLWDEMAIQPQLSHDKQNGGVMGIEDWGTNNTSATADHTLVFMVRFLDDGLKIPISFSFCKTATKTAQLVQCIVEHIQALSAVGLHVVGEYFN